MNTNCFLNRGISSFMEKIITVKQEPIDDAYPTPLSTTTTTKTTASTTSITAAAQNVTTKTTAVVTIPSGTVVTGTGPVTTVPASEPQIFFIQPKPEVQKQQCAGTQGESDMSEGNANFCQNYNGLCMSQ